MRNICNGDNSRRRHVRIAHREAVPLFRCSKVRRKCKNLCVLGDLGVDERLDCGKLLFSWRDLNRIDTLFLRCEMNQRLAGNLGLK